MDFPEADIYTDGACSGNPGPGGWAAVIIQADTETVEISGGEAQTTNQRMELQAAVEGLRYLTGTTRVRLYSDSAYLVNAFELGWIQRWLKNGWYTAAGKPVKNQDLWKQLLEQAFRHRVEWRKVKGHSSDYYNERCDLLARQAIPPLGQ